tara:strand:- start:1504 stop:1818 length:315 start_codon:yes stop_codon:yes gene_type:complete
MTRGRAHKVNQIAEPLMSILVRTIETNNPIKRLVRTTAKNNEIVFKNKLITSHDSKKLERDLEKVKNLQIIYPIGDINVTNIIKFAAKSNFGAFIINTQLKEYI